MHDQMDRTRICMAPTLRYREYALLFLWLHAITYAYTLTFTFIYPSLTLTLTHTTDEVGIVELVVGLLT